MNKAVPWSIKGVGFDAREAAREAARRQGMSLAEWMNSIIAERAAAAGVSVADMDGDERLEAVTARLQGMSDADRQHDDPPAAPAPSGRAAPSGRGSMGEAVAEITRRQRALENGLALPVGLRRGSRDEDLSDDERRPVHPRSRRQQPNQEFDDYRSRRDEDPYDGGRRPVHPPGHGHQPNQEFGDYRSRRDEDPYDGGRRPVHPRSRRQQPNQEFDDYRSRKRDDHKRTEREPLLEAAIKAFERRAAKTQKQAAEALDAMAQMLDAGDEQREVLEKFDKRLKGIEAGLAHRVGEAPQDVFTTLNQRLTGIEAGLARQSAEDGHQPIKGALARLEARLDSMGRSGRPASSASHPSEDQALIGRLESKLNKILAAVEAPAAATSAAPAPFMRVAPSVTSPLGRRSIGEAVAEIARRQRALDEGTAPPMAALSLPTTHTPDARSADAVASLQKDIAELDHKLDAMRRDFLAQSHSQASAEAPACNLDNLRTEISAMSETLGTLASRGSIAKLEGAIRTLTERIEASRGEGVHDHVLEPIESLVRDLRHSLAEIDPRKTIRGLEREIQVIGGKIEDLGKTGLAAAGFGRIQAQTQEIRDLLAATAASPLPVERLEKQVAALAERIERQSAATTLHEGAAVRGAADEIRALLESPARNGAMQAVEGSLDALARKLDEAIGHSKDDSHYTALSRHLDTIHDEIAARPGGGIAGAPIDVRSLEASVRALAATMEAAQEQADHTAMAALERQMGDLAQRLEHSNFGALGSLERSIGDLFAELEETRRATLETAEKAARIAARDTLQEVMASLPLPGGAPHASGELTREIADLRAMQDAADQRTHSTLNAVHETLEKVVDRLAMLEEEIAEVRPAVPSQLLAAGPAPVFAHPHRGEEDLRLDPAGSERRRASPLDPAATAPSVQGADFLLEPGTGFPGRQNRDASEPSSKVAGKKTQVASGKATAEPEIATGRSDFIAAARRAALAAQNDSAAAGTGRPPQGDGKTEQRAGLIEQARTFLAGHKRPLVLSVAALFLAVGAYAVLTMNGPSPDMSVNEAQRASGKAAARLPDTPPADAPRVGAAALAPEPASGVDTSSRPQAPQSPQPEFAPPTNVPAPAKTSQAIPGSDPIVVGTIAGHPVTSQPLLAQPAARAPVADSRPDLRPLAEAGNVAAQYELALRYTEGRGEARDAKQAAHWFEKAAAQGSAPAQYRLGSFYERGLGVPRDLAQARSLYERAALKGNARAMHNLAVLCADGGGKPDYATAASWFRKAAEFGIRDSQYNLAILLARGLGAQQNLIQSYMWFAVAAAQGDDDAGKKRDDVGTKLDAKSLATAKAIADAFHAKPLDPAANEAPALPAAPEVAPPAAPTKATKPKISQL